MWINIDIDGCEMKKHKIEMGWDRKRNKRQTREARDSIVYEQIHQIMIETCYYFYCQTWLHTQIIKLHLHLNTKSLIKTFKYFEYIKFIHLIQFDSIHFHVSIQTLNHKYSPLDFLSFRSSPSLSSIFIKSISSTIY